MASETASDFKMLAKTLSGLEKVLATELQTCGAQKIDVRKRAVSFSGNVETMYRLNLCLRTALRILKPIAKFRVRNERQLYDKTSDINWTKYMGVDDTLAVDSVVRSDYFKHSKFAALKVKDAMVDRFRKEFGRRPSVDVVRPTLRLNVHIFDDICTLSLDSSGDSLHKRGYRLEKSEAPLNEILAAGLVQLSEWDATIPFVDPMCGSGTIAIEAALLACNIAPGLGRSYFGFMTWPDFDKKLWQKIVDEARAKIVEPKAPIIASDMSKGVVRIAHANIKRAKLSRHIELSQSRFEDLLPPAGPGIIIINPPYGERMQQHDLVDLYGKIGDQLKQGCHGYEAWILSSNKEGLKHIGLRPSRKLTLFNGPLECKYHRFSIYQGSVKSKYKKSGKHEA